jgi:hypothetical protein
MRFEGLTSICYWRLVNGDFPFRLIRREVLEESFPLTVLVGVNMVFEPANGDESQDGNQG